ncbi:MAG: class I SAM-dependent methyltransferase [Acidimicrobiales bacterium]|nr:class I SAM-dependent methyltransferase [Acidimicrobiales bacterium]
MAAGRLPLALRRWATSGRSTTCSTRTTSALLRPAADRRVRRRRGRPGVADAGARAWQRGVTVDYRRGDMRAIPWVDRFDAVVSWFTAYGYFDDEQNRAVLAGVHRSLRPGGRFLVELNHKDGLLPHWLPSTVERVVDDVLIDERTFDPLTGRSHARRTTIRDGRVHEASFFVRLFGYTELRDWLLQAGFRDVVGFAGDGADLTAASRRMILVAQK